MTNSSIYTPEKLKRTLGWRVVLDVVIWLFIACKVYHDTGEVFVSVALMLLALDVASERYSNGWRQALLLIQAVRLEQLSREVQEQEERIDLTVEHVKETGAKLERRVAALNRETLDT